MSCAFVKVRRAVVCSAMRAATVARRVGGGDGDVLLTVGGMLRGGGVASVAVYAVGLAAVGWLSVVQLSYTVAQLCTFVNNNFEKSVISFRPPLAPSPPHSRRPHLRRRTRRPRCPSCVSVVSSRHDRVGF